ncbi:MAG TPA: hypothetical protein VEY51_16580 [Chondromyces sp.]|nr:hypothetical protein [Chondromyces sp.]
MKIIKIILSIFSTLCFLTSSGYGQSPSEIILEAIKQSGDWQNVSTLSFTSSSKNSNRWQAYDFFNPKPFVNVGVWNFNFKDGYYQYNTIANNAGGYQFNFTNIGRDTSRYIYDNALSRSGKVLQKGSKALFDAGLSNLNQYFPYFQLRAVLQSRDSLSMRLEGSAMVVKRHLKNGTFEEFHFSKENLLLQKMVYTSGLLPAERRFENYIKINGLTFPEKTSFYVQNLFNTTESVANVKVNHPFDTALLALPRGYVLTPITSLVPKVSEISKDVFMISNVSGGRNILFVNMDDYIVVTEAPINSDVTQSLIDLIHKTIPSKPIKYIHLSHFHNDHSQGIRSFIADGATLLATKPVIDVMKLFLNDNSLSFKDRLSKEPKEAKYESFSKIRTLKDSQHELQFHEIKNSHAKGLSFVYLPKEKIIYQGDLFSLPDDGTITPAIEVTREFYAYLKKNKIIPVRIIGHHGHSNITNDMLKAAIEMSSKKKNAN